MKLDEAIQGINYRSGPWTYIVSQDLWQKIDQYRDDINGKGLQEDSLADLVKFIRNILAHIVVYRDSKEDFVRYDTSLLWCLCRQKCLLHVEHVRYCSLLNMQQSNDFALRLRTLLQN